MRSSNTPIIDYVSLNERARSDAPHDRSNGAHFASSFSIAPLAAHFSYLWCRKVHLYCPGQCKVSNNVLIRCKMSRAELSERLFISVDICHHSRLHKLPSIERWLVLLLSCYCCLCLPANRQTKRKDSLRLRIASEATPQNGRKLISMTLERSTN